MRNEHGRPLVDLEVSIEFDGLVPKDGPPLSGSISAVVTIRADTGRSHKQEKTGPLVATLDGNNPGKLTGKVTIQSSETTTYSYSF